MADSSKIEVIIETESDSFWWSVYNLEPFCWDDVTIHIYGPGRKEDVHVTTISTKLWFKHIKEQYPEEIQEGECSPFGKSIDELIEEKNILFGYVYGDPNDPAFYEMTKIMDKRNARGIRPAYVDIFHPAEHLTLDVVIEAVSKYCIDLLKIKPEKISFKEIMPEAEAKKSYCDELETRKHIDEFIKCGRTFKVRLIPEVVEQIYGTESVLQVGGIENIQHGYIDKDNKTKLVLKDGSEQDINQENIN